ncbi:ASCH domain-containing protein [Cupriavidus metallidurans]|uniref:ASCH domain-containing protein n=1 Tax=Cupriavidus metallidurans TaxID=119219 RepID=UPI0004931588|nr:ASCH domain-containing protein [Cupriavidus metallidurans]MDE4918331.1 ASCH domain-containing protein [Cupriavidus metallidurans]
MKALSIRQPWAWLIAQGFKDIENRTWRTSFRGRVLIHASKGMTRGEYQDVKDYLSELYETGPYDAALIALPKFEQMERGGIVGVATITDCVPDRARQSQWHMEGQFGFQIVDAKALPFVPCKGALGFFDVPADVAAILREQHARTSVDQGVA